jgi:hypothetical protein
LRRPFGKVAILEFEEKAQTLKSIIAREIFRQMPERKHDLRETGYFKVCSNLLTVGREQTAFCPM